MKIAIAGTGYEGLIVGVCLAEVGHIVTCVDVDEEKIKRLKLGEAPIYEADLERLMQKNYALGKLDYTTDEVIAYVDADIIFIDVGVPRLPDGSEDMSLLKSIANKIAKVVKKDSLIVVKSTVPVGTCDELEEYMNKNSAGNIHIEVVSNPEFFAKGTAIRDTLKASGIVIGTESEWAQELIQKVYEPFHCPIVCVSRKSAEMMKYAANNFLALKISYMNDIANLCEKVGADIEEVAQGLSCDSRIGFKFLGAGIGYGGISFSYDTKALECFAIKHGYELRTVKSAIAINKEQRVKLFEKASKRFASFTNRKVAVLGLTYKQGTDDCREAPAADNVSLLLQDGADIVAYDPVGISNFKKLYPEGKHGNGSISYTDNIISCLDNADVCFIFTDWGKIRMIKPDYFRMFMKTPIVYDGRNIFDIEVMNNSKVEYHSIGRRHSHMVNLNDTSLNFENEIIAKQYRHDLIYNRCNRLMNSKIGR